ncbi:MAG: hypothetical protein ACK4MS_12390 [Paracoccaceae bacterium]
MTTFLSEEDVLAAVPGLTRTRLVAFIEAEVIIPLRQDAANGTGHAFRQIDIARMHLLCDLADDLDLDETALGIVITLIDQLHATRADLRAIARALDAEAPEVRGRIGAALLASRG